MIDRAALTRPGQILLQGQAIDKHNRMMLGAANALTTSIDKLEALAKLT